MSYIDWIRARVGRQKIFLVFATVIVQDDNGRILLQRRTDFDFWGLPGGVLELDEDISTCARRELLEETGLTVGELTLVGIYTDPDYDVTYPNGHQCQQFTICFSATVSGGAMQPDGRETTEQHFFTAAEIATRQLPIWYRHMLQDFYTCHMPAFRPPRRLPHATDQIASIRPFIGNARLIAPGSSVLIQRDDGRILIVQRQDNGIWVLPAGYADLGENAAYTAVREVHEETALTISPQRLIGVYSHPLFEVTYPNGDQVKNVGVLFAATLVGGQLNIDHSELRAAEWVPPTQIATRIFPGYQPYVAHIMSCLDKGWFVI